MKGRSLVRTAAGTLALSMLSAYLFALTPAVLPRNAHVVEQITTSTQGSLKQYALIFTHENTVLRGVIQSAEQILETSDAYAREGEAPGDFTVALDGADLVLNDPLVDRASRLRAISELSSAVDEARQSVERLDETNRRIRKIAGSSVVGVYSVDQRSGWVLASVRPDYVFTAASTYKLFVAYSMIKAVETKEWSWNDSLLPGLSLSTCFDLMIIESDNDCPEEWLRRVGTDRVQEQLHSLGADSSKVARSKMRTTASDLAHTLQAMLFDGAIGLDGRLRLENALEKQQFRDGIPAGIESATVLDKVGFLEDYLHDAAFVSSNAGDFILVILTSGASWDTIAEVASAVNDSL